MACCSEFDLALLALFYFYRSHSLALRNLFKVQSKIHPLVFRHQTLFHTAPQVFFGQYSALLVILSRGILTPQAPQIRRYDVLAFRIVVQWERATLWRGGFDVHGAAAWGAEARH